jgi:hypothetical protein
MHRFAKYTFVCAALIAATPAFAQQPPTDAVWSYPQIRTVQNTPAVPPPLPEVPPNEYVPERDGPIATGLPQRRVRVRDLPTEPGQQHWVYANLGLGQPSTARVGVKVWARPQNSVWVEAFAGSAVWNAMYGFGVRMQHTAISFRNGDQLMVSPGAGIHILPNWDVYSERLYSGGWWYPDPCYRNTLYFVYGDVDISWLHDFSPHFGFELGMKLGVAGLVSGNVGENYPRGLMFGKSAYPIIGVYTGFRF